MKETKGKAIALLPILVFLVLYLGTGLILEYVIKIEMGFYSVPVVVAFMIAILVACLQNKKVSFEDKLSLMAKGVGDKNILTMIFIFVLAGIFVGVLGRSSASSAAYFLLSFIPAKFAVAVLFIVACFVSTAMGTSVGTITIIVPIAVNVAEATGFSVPLCVGTVIGGAMFGDNLSFISDTTIAACNTQGCQMKDKFKENFLIALPAALVTLAIVIVMSLTQTINGEIPTENYELIQLIPYVLVLVCSVIGINVFVNLIIGIVSGAVIMLATGVTTPINIMSQMTTGFSGMYETIMVAILVSALCALIKEYGGFDYVLYIIKKIFKGNIGGQLGMGLLVGAVDIATANNTVAIVVAGPIAKEMSDSYGISPRKAASVLDVFSCIFQAILPYGAQMLIAVSTVITMNHVISAADIIPFLFYPMLLAVSVIVSMFIKSKKA